MSMFKKAKKLELKARIALSGVSGSGKTYTALVIATELAKGEPIAVIDTENGSASRYADLFTFDVCELEAPYDAEKFIAAILEAQKHYKVIVVDSLSHAWYALLDKVSQLSEAKGKYNNYTAWGPAGKIQDKLIQTILQCPSHVISTMRAKTKYAQEQYEEKGQIKNRVVKLGMESIQREGLEYEFDLCLDMDLSNTAQVTKSRCPDLAGRNFIKPGKEFCSLLIRWLNSGEREETTPQKKEYTFADLWKLSSEKLGKDLAKKFISEESEAFGVEPKQMTSEQIQNLIEKL